MNPRVSVIMAVHNGEEYLEAAVRSILDQTLRDFELIVVNDGSTDRSPQILRRLQEQDARIVLLDQRSKEGLTQSLNYAASQAKSPLLARMDADDVSLPHRLEAQVAYLEAHPSVAAVGGQALTLMENRLTDRVLRMPVSPDDIRKEMARRSAIIHPTAMFRRSMFEKIGGYRRVFTYAQDHDLWLRLAEHADLANLDEVLIHYRVHAGQLSIQRLREQLACSVAARASARMRARGLTDPADHVTAITPDCLPRFDVDLGAYRTELSGVLVDRADSMRRLGRLAEAQKVTDAAEEWLAEDRALYQDDSRWIALRCLLLRDAGRPGRAVLFWIRAFLRHPSLFLVTGRWLCGRR